MSSELRNDYQQELIQERDAALARAEAAEAKVALMERMWVRDSAPYVSHGAITQDKGEWFYMKPDGYCSGPHPTAQAAIAAYLASGEET